MSRTKITYSGPERRKAHVAPNIGSLKSIVEEGSIDVQVACGDLASAAQVFLASLMEIHGRAGATRQEIRARTARLTGVDLKDAA